MTRAPLRARALAPVLLALGATALAARTQAQNIDVTLTKIDDREGLDSREFINRDECRRNVDLEFELRMVPQDDRKTIDVYQGSACNESTRTDVETGCKKVTSESVDGVTMTITIPVQDIATAISIDCESGAGAPSLWFLAVKSPDSTEAVTDYGIFPKDPAPSGQVGELTIDADPPSAPRSVKGGSGERQIPVSWKSSDGDVNGFLVFVDSNASMDADAGGNCGSDVLVEGANADDLEYEKRAPDTSDHTDLSPSNIDGDFAAVAVAAEDEAGNRSPLSNIDCVSVVPTNGFWDVYRAQGGQAKTGCSLRPASSQSLAWLLPLGTLLAWRARRRWRR